MHPGGWRLATALVLALSAGGRAARPAETRFPQWKNDGGVHYVTATDNKFYAAALLPDEYPAGDGLLTFSYRTVGAWGAFVGTTVDYEPRAAEQPGPWQNLTASAAWTTATLPIRLAHPGRLRLVFNKTPDTGTVDRLEVKDVRLAPAPAATDNLLPNDGYFVAVPGGFPDGWTRYGKSPEHGNGPTGRYGFEAAETAFRLTGAPGEAGCIQAFSRRFPAAGTVVEFSVWARAADEAATLKLRLLGDNYAWAAEQRVVLGNTFTKHTLRLAAPEKAEKSPLYWCRIDVEAGQSAVLGRAELRLAAPAAVDAAKDFPPNVTLSRNRVTNPDFELGHVGYDQWRPPLSSLRPSARQAARPEPAVQRLPDGNRVLRMEPATALCTWLLPADRDADYSLSFDLRRAEPGRNAEVTAMVLDSNWKSYGSQTFAADDDWRRVHLSGRIGDPGRRPAVYLRFDPGAGPLLLDNVQFEAARTPTAFTTIPVQTAFAALPGRSNFFADDEADAAMEWRVRSRPEVSGPLTARAEILDAWGRVVRTEVRTVPARTEWSETVRVNPDGRRGVFHVRIVVDDPEGRRVGYGESRYAVLRDVSGRTLPDNPVAGHLDLNALPAEVAALRLPLLNRFLPLSGFNRHFSPFPPEDAELMATAADLLRAWDFRPPVAKVVEIGLGPKDLHDALVAAAEPTPELLERYRGHVRATVAAYGDAAQGYELFNEPNLWRFASGPRKGEPSMPPEKGALLHRVAYPVLKEANPRALLVGPCANGAGFLDWTGKFLAAGGGAFIDAFSFHGYCDDPDAFDMAARIRAARRLLEDAGRPGLAMWNTEQYFGARVPFLRATESEFKNGYFRDHELSAAAATVVNLVHHAAEGAKLGLFAFEGVCWTGLRDDYLVLDATGGINAAVDFLGDAGRGEELPFGASARAFLFPTARGGPLVTLHTRGREIVGTLTPPPGANAFDFMGNPVTGERVTLSETPCYLRFPAGTDIPALRAALAEADVLGLGEPFAAQAFFDGPDVLVVRVVNRRHRPATVRVGPPALPGGWRTDAGAQTLETLAPGQSGETRWPLAAGAWRPAEAYAIGIPLAAGGERNVPTARVAALPVRAAPGFAATGDPAAWADAEWIELGDGHVSKKYHIRLDRAGPDDLSAKFALRWNEQGLYAAVTVRDDVWRFPDHASGAWAFDSLQVYMDLARGRGTGGEGLTEWQVAWVGGKRPVAYLSEAPSGRYIGENNQMRGEDPDVRTHCRRLPDGGVFYELFFPASALPGVRLRAGGGPGFSLLVNDNDGGAPADRKTGLTTAPRGTEPFQNPQDYLDLVFLP